MLTSGKEGPDRRPTGGVAEPLRTGPAEGYPRRPEEIPCEGDQTVKELPQPQPPFAFGFLKVNPAPIMVVT